MQAEILEKILKRLDILIGLEVNPSRWEKEPTQSKIERLYFAGLKTNEIGRVLGISSEKISKQIWVIKNKRNKKIK